MARWRRQAGEDGFTLIELLVVVIIVGILAAIAVPTLMEQRRRAWASAAQSDLRHAAMELETWFEENMTYAGITGDELRSSGDNTLILTDADTESYCLVADHQKLPGEADFHYDLTLGRPVPGPC